MVVRFLIAWAAAHADLAKSEEFMIFGRILGDMISWCNFPEPLRDLFNWSQILTLMPEILAMETADDTFIILHCSRKWPGSGKPPPKALHSLLRMHNVNEALMAMYSLNAVIYSWVAFLPDFALASPSTFPALYSDLQSLRWWSDNLIFILTDSPPSSGTDMDDIPGGAASHTNLGIVDHSARGGVTSDVNSGETNQLGSMDDSVLMDRDHGGVSN